MKINLAIGMLICAIFISVVSYAQYHFGVNTEEQFQQGAYFVIGIVFLIIALLMWIFAPGLVIVEIFKRKKKRTELSTLFE